MSVRAMEAIAEESSAMEYAGVCLEQSIPALSIYPRYSQFVPVASGVY